MSALWSSLLEHFAWPWMLAALPLPLLVHWWLPPARDAEAAPAMRMRSA